MKPLIITLIACLAIGSLHGAENDRINAKRVEFLKKIFIPRVEFEDTAIDEAISFAWARTVELDSTLDPKRKGVSILLRYPTGEMFPRRGASDDDSPANPKKNRINYQARNITLLALLKEIAQQTGYDLYTTSVGVVFCPPGTSPFPNAYSINGEIWEALIKSPQIPQPADQPTTALESEKKPNLVSEAIPLDPNSPNIVGQFHRVGLPKYTEIEKQVIDRAQKLQNSHTATFNKIEIGKSVFDYQGLIAMGTICHDEGAKIPYTLTTGIRPHISEFTESFGLYRIQFDANGIVKSKSKVHYSWDKNLK